MTNYYRILGLRNFSSLEEIKRAYRSLSKKYHPDSNRGNTAFQNKFIEIQQAYEFLKNPTNKARLDNYLRNPYSHRRTYSSTGSSTRHDDGTFKSKNRRRYEEKYGKTGSENTYRRPHTEDKLDRRSILLYIVFPIVAFPILFWLFVPLNKAEDMQDLRQSTGKYTDPPPPMQALRPLYRLDLNGTPISTYNYGMEEQMVFFLGLLDKHEKSPKDFEETWFSFDRTEFAENSSTDVDTAGRIQLDNIVKILEAFPDAKILITVSNIPPNFVVHKLYSERLESIREFFSNKEMEDRVKLDLDFDSDKKVTLNKSTADERPEFVLRFYD